MKIRSTSKLEYYLYVVPISSILFNLCYVPISPLSLELKIALTMLDAYLTGLVATFLAGWFAGYKKGRNSEFYLRNFLTAMMFGAAFAIGFVYLFFDNYEPWRILAASILLKALIFLLAAFITRKIFGKVAKATQNALIS